MSLSELYHEYSALIKDLQPFFSYTLKIKDLYKTSSEIQAKTTIEQLEGLMAKAQEVTQTMTGNFKELVHKINDLEKQIGNAN